MFTINKFWKSRLLVPTRKISKALKGWKHIDSEFKTFLEAPLHRASGFGNADPRKSSVILVSAPGAVGKSTLARQIAFETGAILLDLAKAAPVGANTLAGGLARTDLYQSFQQGEASIVIDGLDEARMRVTQAGFAAFISDVVDLAKPNCKPVVLFGRTVAVQDAWLWLAEEGIEAPVLEIGYYNQEQAADFAKIQAKKIRREARSREPDGRAIDLIMGRLTSDLQAETSFVGYAPVLIAVAKEVADPSNPDIQNTQALISRIERGQEKTTITEISNSILSREQRKLSSLSFEDQTLHNSLYTPDEQIVRLIEHLYGNTTPPPLPPMSVQDRQTYNEALDTWVSEHPFLDGLGNLSSAVFGGLLASKALHTESVAEVALHKELARGTSTNPFLAEFYIEELKSNNSKPLAMLQAEHVGILYASLRARLSQGESASLRIDGEVDEDDDQMETAQVEISRKNQKDEEIEPFCFSTEHKGHFRFGSHIEDIDITAPESRVSVGHGTSEIVLVTPVSIDSDKITLETAHVVIETSPRSNDRTPDFDIGQVVNLKTNNLDAPRVIRPPTIRGKATLEVSGPGFKGYPWQDFAVIIPDEPDHRIKEALHRLKNIFKLFRSHRYGTLAKKREAIESRRRTKGSGKLVLNQLLEDDVLRIEERMYSLDPIRLSEIVGLKYQDLYTAHTTPTTTKFLKRALNQNC